MDPISSMLNKDQGGKKTKKTGGMDEVLCTMPV